MLGFDAVGRLALGQISGLTTITLTAAVGSFVLSGNAALFSTRMASGFGSFSLSGNAAGFIQSISASAGSLSLTGISALFSMSIAPSVGSYVVTGIDVGLIPSSPTIVRRLIGNGGICLGFDALGFLAIAELPQTQEDTSQFPRKPLYTRGVSYWKGRS